jgi:MraZ protein
VGHLPKEWLPNRPGVGRVAQMFLGTYLHNIDSKGRLTLPAKFRAELARGVVVTPGLDDELWVFPMETWESLDLKMSELPLNDRDSRNFGRLWYASASECELDKQGRILLPGTLRDRAGLDGETVIVGAGRRLEIWSREGWTRTSSEIEKNGDAIAERLFQLGMRL